MIETLVASLVLGPVLHLSVRVDGDGLLRFAREGRIVYAKSATLDVKGGLLCDSGGATLLPQVAIPGSPGSLDVDLDGNVYVVKGISKTAVGRLVLATFPNEKALKPSGGFLISSERSKSANPGEGTAGVIRLLGTAPTQDAHVRPVQTNNATTHSGQPIVTVRPTSLVGGPTFTLGEIADIKAPADIAAALAAVSLGAAPQVGAARTLELWELKSRLKVAKIDPLGVTVDMPAKATVALKSQPVPFSKLVEVGMAGIKEKLGGIPLAAPDPQADVDVPLGAVEVRFEECSKSEKFVSAGVGIYVDGKRVNIRTLTFTPSAATEGVRSGDAVTIVLISGGASIEVSGHVRSNGWVGQTVTVVTETGSTHTGTVVAKNRIEVRL